MTELADLPETGTGEIPAELSRRLVAEALGTGLLIVAVIGSGIMASRLSPSDVGLQLLENAAATAGALIGLILIFGSISGGHFNPVVTLVDRAYGTISSRDTGLYVIAQIIGGCLGAIVANLMFDLPAVEWSTTSRSSGALWLSEVVATIGLLLVIHGCVRTGRAGVVAFAVGLWIGGAYFFTSSTSFANPAVTIARTLSDTFAGIEPSSAPMFIVMQLLGGVLAFFLIRFLYPNTEGRWLMASSDQLTLAQRHVLLTVRTQLQDEFAGVFGPETIERFLTDSLDKLLPQARITTFTPVFAERFARDRLTALAKIEGKTPRDHPLRAVPVRPQRRPLPDGRRLAATPRRRPRPRLLRRLRTGLRGQLGGDRGDGRGRHRHRHPVPEAVDRRDRPGRRRRRHDGLR